MTDTLHSRILRTIEDWNRDFSHGVMQGDMYALAVRIDRLFQASVTPEFLTTLRADLIKQIELLDRTLNLAENSDAEKERDEFAIKFANYLHGEGVTYDMQEQRTHTMDEHIHYFKQLQYE